MQNVTRRMFNISQLANLFTATEESCLRLKNVHNV